MISSMVGTSVCITKLSSKSVTLQQSAQRQHDLNPPETTQRTQQVEAHPHHIANDNTTTNMKHCHCPNIDKCLPDGGEMCQKLSITHKKELSRLGLITRHKVGATGQRVCRLYGPCRIIKGALMRGIWGIRGSDLEAGFHGENRPFLASDFFK